MRERSSDFLFKLLDTPSPSGFEGNAQKLWCRYVSDFADTVKMDVHGNAIACVNPGGKPRVMISGHIDEIGLMIHYINDEGFLHFKKVGGVRSIVLSGHWVRIIHGEEEVKGIIGKNIFWTGDDKNKELPKLKDLTIDIGAKNKKDAEKRVSPGDPAVIDIKTEILEKDLLVSRGLDDRIGAFVAAEVLRNVAGKNPSACFYAVSTVQEEIGCRGAITSAYGIEPDAGIAVDITPSSDSPQIEKKELGDVALKKGPVITRGAPANPVMEKDLIGICEKNDIPYQLEAAPEYSGTDADYMQISRKGVASETVSIPCRYVHTPTEMVSLKDVDNTIKLLGKYVLMLEKDKTYTMDWKK